MQRSFALKVLSPLLILTFIGGLFLYSTRETKAQDSHRVFLDILRPYVNKDIRVAFHGGESTDPVLLKEVGQDYVLLESPQRSTQAIPLQTIRSITFDDVPQIFCGK